MRMPMIMEHPRPPGTLMSPQAALSVLRQPASRLLRSHPLPAALVQQQGQEDDVDRSRHQAPDRRWLADQPADGRPQRTGRGQQEQQLPGTPAVQGAGPQQRTPAGDQRTQTPTSDQAAATTVSTQ